MILLKRSHFLQFGERYDIRPAAVHGMLDRLCEKAEDWPAELDRIGFGARRTKDLQQLMNKRLQDLS